MDIYKMHVFPMLIKACQVVQTSQQSAGTLYLCTWQPLSDQKELHNYCDMKYLCGISLPEEM